MLYTKQSPTSRRSSSEIRHAQGAQEWPHVSRETRSDASLLGDEVLEGFADPDGDGLGPRDNFGVTFHRDSCESQRHFVAGFNLGWVSSPQTNSTAPDANIDSATNQKAPSTTPVRYAVNPSPSAPMP